MTTLKKAVVRKVENSLVWEFADGKSVEVNPADFSAEVREQAMLHGLRQKLSDSYAGAKTVLDARGAFQGVLDALAVGTWNGGRSSAGGIWVEALAKAAGKSLEEALDTWNGLDEDTRKKLKQAPAVKLAKAGIELERAQAKAGTGRGFDLENL